MTWSHIKGEDNIVADVLSRCHLLKMSKDTNSTLRPRTEPQNEMEEKHILANVHERLAHPGIKTMEMALRKFWKIKSLRTKLNKMRNECEICQKNMVTNTKYGKIKGGIGTVVPWKHVSSDIYGLVDSYAFEEGKE